MKWLVLMLSLLVCCSAVPAWAAPQVVVAEPEFDFGSIYQGQSVRHAFVFSNAGDEPLEVEKVRSSCGCTAVLASAKTLAPGESGEIEANFDSTRFRGSISKTIYLYTNDLTQPVSQLYVKGKVKEVVSAEPKQLNFGQLEIGQPTTLPVTLVNQSDETFPIEAVEATAPELQAEALSESLIANEKAVVNVTLTLKPGRSRFSGYVMVKLAGAAKTELRIPVYATIK
jgi:hypothetical protein